MRCPDHRGLASLDRVVGELRYDLGGGVNTSDGARHYYTRRSGQVGPSAAALLPYGLSDARPSDVRFALGN
jgi:hypothetical protein